MITRDGAKMSKSKGNVVSPAGRASSATAPTRRAATSCSSARPSQDADWSDEGVGGVHRFLSRLWTAAARGARTGAAEPGRRARPPLLRKAHWAIDKVTRDMSGRFAFNTAIAAVMELVNEIYRERESSARVARALRDRHRRLADLPVRAAPRRRGLRADDRRARVGGALAAGRPGAAGHATRSSWSCSSTASWSTGSPAPAEASREQLEEIARGSGKLAARLNGKRDREGRGGARQARQLRGPMSTPEPRRTPLPVGPLVGVDRRGDADREPVPRLVRRRHRLHRLRVPRPAAGAAGAGHDRARWPAASASCGPRGAPGRVARGRRSSPCSSWPRSWSTTRRPWPGAVGPGKAIGIWLALGGRGADGRRRAARRTRASRWPWSTRRALTLTSPSIGPGRRAESSAAAEVGAAASAAARRGAGLRRARRGDGGGLPRRQGGGRHDRRHPARARPLRREPVRGRGAPDRPGRGAQRAGGARGRRGGGGRRRLRHAVRDRAGAQGGQAR